MPTVLAGIVLFFPAGETRALAALSRCGLSSSATLPGALATWFWIGETRAAIPCILALSAASFIYIAVADLIPNLHRHVTPGASLRQLTLLLAGIATIAFFHF